MELNFGEKYGGFYFAFLDTTSLSYSAYDRYLDVSIYQMEINGLDSLFTDQEISVDAFTPDNFPEEFENQVFDPSFLEIGPIYSSKELNKLVLQNAKFALNSKLIHISVR